MQPVRSDTGGLFMPGQDICALRLGWLRIITDLNWPSSRVAYLIAGGPEALLRPVEGAEDSPAAAKEAVAALNIKKGDILIGVAASGTTPYSIAALEAGKAASALTIGIANNPDTGLLAVADYPVLLATGAEALAGSTRLKAGTAQKICLNLISTQLMVLQGRVKNGLMSEMQPRNEKCAAAMPILQPCWPQKTSQNNLDNSKIFEGNIFQRFSIQKSVLKYYKMLI